MDDEIASQIEIIEQTLIKDSVLGFDPAILSVLDNVEIGQDKIEDLKSRLGTDFFMYLFNIANSAYHGGLKVGPVKHFFDVVNRIGMQHTKALIIQFASHRLARGDSEAEIIFAKNFAASVVGRIMARGFGFRDDGARKVELACLLSGIGALMMTVYRNHYHTGDFVLSDDFIEQNHLYLTERIIRIFQLPEYLHEMIMTDCFVLERMGIGSPTVVKLALVAVEWSFRTFDNKLVFRSPETSQDDKFTPSLAVILEEQFAAAGLKKYLIILPETT
ncbi:MAG: HDOD domain-containing protein [Syntrophales bacterium]